ncbi:MAG: tyrosine-type recombinase/integrase [Deferrisomatales bacterium]|nr:tyrosine-type recombinase/integrase [Deferrisomatales bacterium]
MVVRNGRLSVRFRYLGEIVQRATGLRNSEANQGKARSFLAEIGKAVQAGTFRMDDAFALSDTEAQFWARLEGRDHRREPEGMTFGEYVDAWRPIHLETDPSERKRNDYDSILRVHLLPAFGDKAFYDLNGLSVVEFVRGLRGRSPSTIRNILIPLRIIWEDAVEEHGWELKNPFDHLKRRNRQGQLIPKRRMNIPRVYRTGEWQALMVAMDPWYRPICEVAVRTGMIPSELCRLRAEHIQGDRLQVCGTKTVYREREVPITRTLRPWLDLLVERALDNRLVTTHEGADYDRIRHSRFRGRYWKTAHERAEIPYRNPYVTRHTFVAWGLRIGAHPDRMVELAGHGSRQMIYERYGMNQRGLEEEVEEIRRLFGEDFR